MFLQLKVQKLMNQLKNYVLKKILLLLLLMGIEQVDLFLKNSNLLLHLIMNYKQMTGVEVEELTPQRLDEILRPIADEIKNGKPAPKLASEDDKSIADSSIQNFPKS